MQSPINRVMYIPSLWIRAPAKVELLVLCQCCRDPVYTPCSPRQIVLVHFRIFPEGVKPMEILPSSVDSVFYVETPGPHQSCS